MKLTGLLSRFGRREPIKTEPEAGDDLYIYAATPATSVVMVTMIGVETSLVDEIITVTTGKFQSQHRIVFITDSLDFMQFRRRGVMFEYLPALGEQRVHASAMPWHSYLNARWELLLSKWRPLHILTYGQNINSYLASAPQGDGGSTAI
ncbi:hypothetical protein [Pararhizobium sp.]|uniref:hypothetical protein n=1 Tax=Pararhizobium sp. TaxID=1977563 RepID=UPI00271F70AA|nr:hypothetical protein [Pararhizobium sp.]MDO9416196.1 hypothetical protein [Pararhizobium sp.]